MKILSIQQPWAWLIVHGLKDVENRTWRTAERGRFLIHAGKQYDRHAMSDVMDGRNPATGERFPSSIRLVMLESQWERGGVIGSADLVDCIELDTLQGQGLARDNPWFVGPFGFVLRDAKPLPFAPMKGQLGFFTESEFAG